jgi:hypothetical protein
VSELDRRRPNAGVLAWLSAAEEQALHVSVLTLGEMQSGIARMHDAVKQARLESSFFALRSRFNGRILAVDEAVAERWGRLIGELAMTGVKAPAIDSLIAATALHHDLTVVTRNGADFRFAGLTVVNPFINE